MTDKIKELPLSVLDMTEEEQLSWCAEHIKSFNHLKESLADLSFRMRHEAVRKYITKWWDACQMVTDYIQNNAIKLNARTEWKPMTGIWFQDFAQPIHIIISALIAKELAKDVNSSHE